jgi:hypothetical protein
MACKPQRSGPLSSHTTRSSYFSNLTCLWISDELSFLISQDFSTFLLLLCRILLSHVVAWLRSDHGCLGTKPISLGKPFITSLSSVRLFQVILYKHVLHYFSHKYIISLRSEFFVSCLFCFSYLSVNS